MKASKKQTPSSALFCVLHNNCPRTLIDVFLCATCHGKPCNLNLVFTNVNGKFIVNSQADCTELSPWRTALSPFSLPFSLPFLSSCTSEAPWFYLFTVSKCLRGLDFARLQRGSSPAGGAVSSSSSFLCLGKALESRECLGT